MNHVLKIWPQYYHHVANGSKTFEVRKNDRGFQNGDTVTLREWDPDYISDAVGYYSSKGTFTDSKSLTFKIGYVLPIDAERVVFSLIKESK